MKDTHLIVLCLLLAPLCVVLGPLAIFIVPILLMFTRDPQSALKEP